MSKTEAQKAYIDSLTKIDPTWQEKAKAQNKIRSKL